MNNVKCRMYNVEWLLGDVRCLMVDVRWKIISIIIMLIINFSNINAQPVDSLINEALQNNPKLKSLQHKIISSEKRSESVNTLPAPNFSVEFSQVPTNSLNILNQANSNNFAISQMFPLGGKLNAMAEIERKNTLIESDNYEIYKTNLIAKIKMSYYSLWLIEKKIEIQNKNISLLNDLLNSLQSAVYTNKINQADVLTLQSEIASNETQLLILEKQREAEIYQMNKLLGRDLNSNQIFIQDFDGPSIKISLTELEKLLSESNPTLKKMNSMITMNKAMIEANNRELIPDLMIQGMLMRMPQGMPITTKTDPVMINGKGKTEFMYGIMASINLPFAPWSINKYKAKEEELFAGIKSIEYEKNDMLREISSEIKSALVKYETSVQLLNLYSEKIIPLYRQTTESQLTAYLNNRTSITTIIDSYRMLLMQEEKHVMAKADIQMAVAEIEFLIGDKIENREVLK